MTHKRRRPYLPPIHESDCPCCEGKGEIFYEADRGLTWNPCEECGGTGMWVRTVRECEDVRLELFLDDPEEVA